MIALVRRILLIHMAAISAGCFAAGLPVIIGVNAEGYTVAASFEGPPYRVEVWKESSSRKERQESAKSFDNEPCVFSEEVDRKGHLVRSFSCSPEARSPLAGTKYRGREVKGSCERGDPDFRYVCIEGCDRNKRAPKKMEQGYYEC